MPVLDANLSIGGAYDAALATAGSDVKPDGSEADKTKAPEKPADGQPAKPVEPKPELNPDGTPKVPPVDPNKKEPVVDPEKGKYEGEYTPERFNGLMSAWQKDRALVTKIPELEKKIGELELAAKTPKPAEKSPDGNEDLPPEIQNADPETQAGFRLLMKAHEGKLSAMEEKIVGKIMDTLNRPLKEENDIVTKVQQETEELSVEFGKDFSDNEKAIKKYAAENKYPLGTLRHAYQAWQKDKKLVDYDEKAKGGKKTIAEIDAEKAKHAEIPHGNANRTGEFPKWDEKRDGNKNISQIFDDIKGAL